MRCSQCGQITEIARFVENGMVPHTTIKRRDAWCMPCLTKPKAPVAEPDGEYPF